MYDSVMEISSNSYKNNWIKNLKKRNLEPVIKILESFEESEDINDILNEAEKKWIKYYRKQGARLTNVTDGGCGVLGYKHTEETKKKIVRSTSGNKNHFYGKKHSKKSRQKMSKSSIGQIAWNKGKERSEATKKKISKSLTGKKNGPHLKETKLKISKAHQKKVICVTENRVFDSQRDAANNYNLSVSTVSNICRGKNKSTKNGLVFSFLGEYCE